MAKSRRYSHATPPTYYACGICDHYHPADWDGDCREDAARFFVDELDEAHGSLGWQEVDMPGTEIEHSPQWLASIQDQPIHHEAWSVRLASETERGSGAGTFDVIENADGFNVYDAGQGLTLESFRTLEEANTEARRLADAWDAERAAERHVAKLIDPAGAAFWLCYAAPGKTTDREAATRFASRAVALRAGNAVIWGEPAAFWNSERESAARSRQAHKGWTLEVEPYHT